jgi:hypothetical protein
VKAHTSDDIENRLQRVMLVLLQNELDSSDFEQLQAHHPELRGMSLDEVQAFVALRKGGKQS